MKDESILVLQFFLALAISLWSTNAFAEEKPVLDQVREIVGSKKGTVLKWTFPPKVAVVHEGGIDRLSVEELIAQIEEDVPGFPGFQAVEYFDVRSSGDTIFGNTRIVPSTATINSKKITSAEVAIDFEKGPMQIQSNILIYFTNLHAATMFGVLMSNAQANRSLRAFVEGSTPCYFNTLSRSDELQIAGIYIRNDLSQQLIDECLYEEFTQSLGLLEDSPRSSIFTYDETSEPKPDRTADIVLLRSLYDPSVRPGDSPDKVAEVFDRLYEKK
jgi:hypothetical protein